MGSLSSEYKFWFYLRKAIFQGLFPLMLTWITFYDLLVDDSGNQVYYKHLYFYTSGILFVYTHCRIILDYIFSITSDDVVFYKSIDLNQTTDIQILSPNINNTHINQMVLVKRIFKLRFSQHRSFKWMSSLSWAVGLDCPILLELDFLESIYDGPINAQTENAVLQSAIVEIQSQNNHTHKQIFGNKIYHPL